MCDASPHPPLLFRVPLEVGSAYLDFDGCVLATFKHQTVDAPDELRFVHRPAVGEFIRYRLDGAMMDDIFARDSAVWSCSCNRSEVHAEHPRKSAWGVCRVLLRSEPPHVRVLELVSYNNLADDSRLVVAIADGGQNLSSSCHSVSLSAGPLPDGAYKPFELETLALPCPERQSVLQRYKSLAIGGRGEEELALIPDERDFLHNELVAIVFDW